MVVDWENWICELQAWEVIVSSSFCNFRNINDLFVAEKKNYPSFWGSSFICNHKTLQKFGVVQSLS